jgi:hypothetical protein
MLRKSNLILVPVVLALVACAHTDPTVKVEIKKVEIPIAVPCKAEVPAKPSFKFETLKTDDDLFDKSKTLLADRKLHLAYEEELLTALKSCIKGEEEPEDKDS